MGKTQGEELRKRMYPLEILENLILDWEKGQEALKIVTNRRLIPQLN